MCWFEEPVVRKDVSESSIMNRGQDVTTTYFWLARSSQSGFSWGFTTQPPSSQEFLLFVNSCELVVVTLCVSEALLEQRLQMPTRRSAWYNECKIVREEEYLLDG